MKPILSDQQLYTVVSLIAHTVGKATAAENYSMKKTSIANFLGTEGKTLDYAVDLRFVKLRKRGQVFYVSLTPEGVQAYEKLKHAHSSVRAGAYVDATIRTPTQTVTGAGLVKGFSEAFAKVFLTAGPAAGQTLLVAFDDLKVRV